MKKLFTLLLTALLTLSLAACQKTVGGSDLYTFPETSKEIKGIYQSSGNEKEFAVDTAIVEWFENLKLEPCEEPEAGEGAETFSFIEDNKETLTYIDRGGNGTFLLMGENWYKVLNPSEPPWTDTAKTVENGVTTPEADYYLSDNDPIQVTDSIEKETVFIVPQSLNTNSTKITVKNKSGVDVEIFLYLENDLNIPIAQMTLGNGKSQSFENLTSSAVYRIGLSADTSTQLDVSITD